MAGAADTAHAQMFRLAAAVLVLVALAQGACRRRPPVPQVAVMAGGMEMVLVPAGRLEIYGESGGVRRRVVEVAPFWIDRHEVTQSDYEALMGANPSRFKNPRAPVERVSWRSAVRYCNARSLREGLTPCYNLETFECNYDADGYRLPTEVEWEYACRAGSMRAFCFGDSEDELRQYAWFRDNSSGRTHPVGQLRANTWGICDMHGNVAEWCNDRYTAGDDAAGASPGAPAADRRVVRGGSFAHAAAGCRSAARDGEDAGFADACLGSEMYGFRCVRKAQK